MPISELGYRHWEGRLTDPRVRWLTIALTGFRLALKSVMLRRIMFASWMWVLFFAVVFFVVGMLTDSLFFETWRGPVSMVRSMLGAELTQALRDDPGAVRRSVWSLIFFYQTFYQIFLGMVITAIVGPPLISRDVQSKAFLVYFSKPITRLDYLLGKASVILLFLFGAGLLPALAIYLVSVLFSPGIEVIVQTSNIVPKIVISSLILGIPSALVMLFYSSMTSSERYASVGWMSTWLLGEFGYITLSATPNFEDSSWIFLLSIRKTIAVAIRSVFDVDSAVATFWDQSRVEDMLGVSYSPTLALGWLAGISVFCFVVIFRRISAPMRI